MMQLMPGRSDHATRVLSLLATVAAVLEFVVSPWIGQQLDRVGRKPVLRGLMGTLVVLHIGTALRPVHIVTIALQKLVGTVVLGFFIVTLQTVFRDLTTTPEQLSTVLGQQGALIGFGFLLGILGAGRLAPFGFTAVYGTAAALVLLAYGVLHWRVPETRPNSTMNATPTSNALSWNSVAAGTRLLTHYGPRVRRLSILYMLMTVHMFMGDLFQIYAATEWHLSTTLMSTYLSLMAATGIVANVIGSVLVRRMGVASFTTLAIASKLLTSTMTAFFGVRGSIWGLMLGFLGSAQSIGVMAALMNAGGASSGSVAGERAALTALLKVLGPILYGTLYIQGQRVFHMSNVPFLFNMGLSVVALILSRRCL
jgi:MFS transporter, DHA1 family, tetracycline resistance protein